MESVLEYLGVAVITALKFLPGVAIAIAREYSFVEQVLVTWAGGTLGCAVFTYFGAYIKKQWQNRKQRIKARRELLHPAPEIETPIPTEPKPRKFIQRVWDRYGLIGVSALTPPLFSPPIGSAICVAFGAPKGKVMRYMMISLAFWSLLFAAAGQGILQLLGL